MASKIQKPKDNVIRFPVEAVSRFGFKRADTARKHDGATGRMEEEGQMNLFNPGESPAGASNAPRPEGRMGAVVPLPTRMGSFDAALMLDDHNDPRAEEMYRRAIDENDYPADAWCNLGVLESLRRKMDDAFECFAQSLVADPRHAESHYNIGNLYFEFGDLKLARAHYEKSIECDPELASAYFNLGLVTALAEDYQMAFDSLTHYKLIAPEDSAVADELLRYLRTAINLT